MTNAVRRLSPEDIAGLLVETSRTFALAVPLLAGRTRTSVGLAYLLFRCADTLEDAATWTIEERQAALTAFARMLDDDGSCDRAQVEDWLKRGVSSHAGYQRLLGLLPELLGETARLPPATSSALRRHARRTALGMRDMIEASSRGLESVEELRLYCYVVAGIVGELLTTLFVQDAPILAAVEEDLVRDQRAFGEGLQLVNVLKDEREDAAEGRVFVPTTTTRSELLSLAEGDLRAARRYVTTLRDGGAPLSFVAFTSLPCELAEETLVALRADGPGAKVSRTRVAAMVARHYALRGAERGASRELAE